MSENSPFALPFLSEIFDALRLGQHLCAEDGKLYDALRDNPVVYQDMFKHLGFQLEWHSRDFFYLRGKDNIRPASKMAVFVFILIEALSDQGKMVVDTLMTEIFAVHALPHFKSERYRAYLKEAGVTSEEGLKNVINQLERLGFAKSFSADTFRFRAPAYRFFDICIEMLNRHDPQPQHEEEQPI